MLDSTCSYYNYYLSLYSPNSNIVPSNTPPYPDVHDPELGRDTHGRCAPYHYICSTLLRNTDYDKLRFEEVAIK